MQNRFNFVGTLSFPKEESKRPFYNSFTKNNRKMRTVNFGVKSDGHNIGFVELFGCEQDIIKARDEDNEPVEVAWSDRFNENVLAGISNMSKYSVYLGEGFERKDFLSPFDMAEYLKDNLKAVGDKVLHVNGRITKDFFNGKVYDRYQVQNIFLAVEDVKPRLNVTLDLAYNRDSIDKTEWKEEKKFYLDAYTPTYIDKDHGVKYVSQRVCLNASKINEENPKQKEILDFRLRFLDISNKKMARMAWDGYLVNGSEEIPFDESQLTDVQRESVALGLKKVEDYRPRGQILGERVQEYRLVTPRLYGDYSDGIVDMDISASEFEDEMVYVPPTEERLEDVIKPEKKSEPEEVEFEEIDEDDLF